MKNRREVIKKNIDEQSLMQYEVAEMANWLTKKLEHGQHVIVPIKMDKVEVIDVETILFILNPKKEITKIHLITGEIVSSIMNIESMQEHLSFFNFKKLDNGLLVNMKKIQWFDSNMHRVYFSKEHYISVAGAAIRNIVKIELGKEKDLYSNKPKHAKYGTDEYFPIGKTTLL